MKEGRGKLERNIRRRGGKEKLKKGTKKNIMEGNEEEDKEKEKKNHNLNMKMGGENNSGRRTTRGKEGKQPKKG